jgi:hypothetical protein
MEYIWTKRPEASCGTRGILFPMLFFVVFILFYLVQSAFFYLFRIPYVLPTFVISCFTSTSHLVGLESAAQRMCGTAHRRLCCGGAMKYGQA